MRKTVKTEPLTQKNKTGKYAVPSRSMSANPPSATIASILKQNKAFSAWLRSRKDGNPEVFITLVEDIPPSDRDELAKLTRLIIHAQDELVKRIAQIEKENEHLKSLLLTDDLTGLYNKRFFSIQLEAEMARTRRTGLSCTLAMMDLDNFKVLNDALGHDAGDRFLVQMAGRIRENLRPTDFACRYGGDEFAVIMPASSLHDSIGIAKRIQTSMAKLTAVLPDAIRERLTCSFGLATYQNLPPMNAETFFKQADMELYYAKNEGKNRISSGRVSRTDITAISAEEKAALSQLL